MTTAAQIKSDFTKLPVGEQIELLCELWNDLAREPGAVALSDDQKRALERRYERHLQHPEEAIPWEEVRDSIRSRRRES
ncbi:MAG: addiction module protein [Deltaproteobacteria bacterium]|nr:addiction module protein [Deltaproteobacteria bacterium]